MLSKKTYREVVKKLEHFRKQHLEDRQENPNTIPAAWGNAICDMVEHTVRANKERYTKGQAEEFLENLVHRGLLIRYVGDYTFPTGEILPTKEEIVIHALKGLSHK